MATKSPSRWTFVKAWTAQNRLAFEMHLAGLRARRDTAAEALRSLPKRERATLVRRWAPLVAAFASPL